MPFGTDFYQSVVLPNMAEQVVPCKRLDISYLPRKEVNSVYVDSSVLLTFLKRERCGHTIHYENIAKAFDKLVENKRTIFISELCVKQIYSSLVSKAWREKDTSCPYPQKYFDLCMEGLSGYRKMELGRKNATAGKLSERLRSSDEGCALWEKIEDNIHAYIARAFGDVTIMTYDPIFFDIVSGKLEIEVTDEKWSLQYKRWEETKPLNVISPESFLGIGNPCGGQKVFNTAPQMRSCEPPFPELRMI